MSTLEQEISEEIQPLSLAAESHLINPAEDSQLLLGNAISHTPKSGLNPIADAAGNLFTLIGKLKGAESWSDLDKLHAELYQEINLFHDTIKNHGYSLEYTVVCRYVMCATLDEIMTHTAFGKNGEWDAHSLLATFNQDLLHQEKFFTIMERIIKEPALYIDLMELMYLCLSMEYKGRYRTAEHGQYQLEQITNSLYKHIRVYRGSFSKILSPTPLKTSKSLHGVTTKQKTSFRTIFIVTACIILTILIGLGYLMDVIANEPKKTTEIGNHA